MIIFPAIDIKDGTCVRLVKGDCATAHKVAENAVETAKSFQNAGASWIHMVDLDGAKDAKPVNSSLVFDVLANTDLGKWKSAEVSAIWKPLHFIWSKVFPVSFWVLWLFAILSL